jgi:hypothetical protein
MMKTTFVAALNTWGIASSTSFDRWPWYGHKDDSA